MLLAAHAEEPEVVVVHQDRPLEASSPASVTVIEVDEALSENEDLAGAVGRASGVSVARLGGLGDLSTVQLRGSSARQVEVYLDGVPLNPDGSGAVDLSELPLRAFERVEIWRGQAPVGLGGTAMGGVVNLVTGDGDVTAFGGTVGSFDSSRLRVLFSRSGPVELWTSASVLATSGDQPWFDNAGTLFEDDDDAVRRRINNDLRMGSASLRLRGGDRVRWTAFDSFVAREDGVPGPTSRPSSAVRYAAARNLAVLQGEVGLLRARLHHRFRRDRLADPAGELALGDEVVNRTHSVGLDVLGHQTVGERSEVSFALGGTADHRVEGGRRFVARAQAGGMGRFGPWTVAPSLAAVQIWSDGAGEADDLAVLPRLGGLLRLGERAVVKANGGFGYRPPDLQELFGNSGALAGRADLRPERGFNVDLGTRVDGDWGSIELGGFGSWSRDLIVYVQNAQAIGVPTNLGAGRVFGVEGAWSWDGLPWLSSQTNITLQRTLNDSEDVAYAGGRLPRLPWLQVDQQTAWVGRSMRIGHTLSVSDGVHLDPANLVRQPTRHLHGLFARVDVGPFQLELDVDNLLDQKAAQVPANVLDPMGPTAPGAITDFIGYPLPGRSFWLSFRFEEAP